MTPFYLLLSFPFFVWIIRNIFYWVYLWQLKEYRLDRVIIHFRETKQGKGLLFSKLSLAKLLAILFFAYVAFNNKTIFSYQVFVAAIILLDFFSVLKDGYNRLLRVPKFTFKAAMITFLTLLIIFIGFLIPFFDGFFWMLILDKVAILLIVLLVYLFSFPTEFYRDYKIEKAIKKIRASENLLVIGITGSYGKSSTKEYVAQLLENNFKVLKTRGTNNTPIGIANTIIAGLKKDTKIFVVEMGAYRVGEIKEMCELVNPNIGILTSVSHQHLSLFKDINNTMEAKYELIKALPKNGIALFNGENENTKNLFNKTKKRKILYNLAQSGLPGNNNQEISAFNIVIGKNFIQFDVKINSLIISKLKAPLLGKHNIEDILPGIYIANYLGMKDKEIRKALLRITPIEKTMIYKNNLRGIVIIDDTFNASPHAVKAVLEYMKIYKNKKILVLQPMIELGKMAKDEHYLLGKIVSNICDFLLLTNYNFYKEILKGILDQKGKCRVVVGSSSKLAALLQSTAKKGDVVVFEGKESALVLEKFHSFI